MGRARRWLPRSVRARTTVAACVVVGVALVVGAIVLVALLERSLVNNTKDAASARARDLGALAVQGALPETLAIAGEEDALVQVVDGDGRVVASSGNLEGEPPITSFRPAVGHLASRRMKNLPIEDDDTFVVAALMTRSPEGPVTVYVAMTLEEVGESVDAVRGILAAGLPVLLLIVGLTAWVFVGRALRPVESIRAQVADISARDLHHRVPVPPVDDEVGRLAATMNEMLSRLEGSSERQRRFVSDASHELRTPLASSRTELEVALAHPERADWPTVASEVLEENRRMENLVRDLLYLARSDEGARPFPPGPVELDAVVLAEAERARGRGPVRIDPSGVSGAVVSGREADLARVVRNLLDNAVRHARTEVRVRVDVVGEWAVVTVEDDGAGVAVQDRERIFERFTRPDEARARGGGGAGLGLAIVREVVEAHGGSVGFEDGSPGARFVVRLPLGE